MKTKALRPAGRRRFFALNVVLLLAAMIALAIPVQAEECRGTREWYDGACRYPDEIAKLKAQKARKAAEARRRAQEAARRKAEAEAKRREDEQRKTEPETDARETPSPEPAVAAEPPEPVEPPRPTPPSQPSPPPAAVAQPASPPPAAVPPPPVPTSASVTQPLPLPDPADERGVSPVAYVGFGVAAVGVLVGAITGGISLSQQSTLREECPNDICAPEKEYELSEAMALGHVSTASFVVAGLAVGVGVIGLVHGGSESKGSVAILPHVGPGSVGLTGRF